MKLNCVPPVTTRLLGNQRYPERGIHQFGQPLGQGRRFLLRNNQGQSRLSLAIESEARAPIGQGSGKANRLQVMRLASHPSQRVPRRRAGARGVRAAPARGGSERQANSGRVGARPRGGGTGQRRGKASH